MSFEEEFDKIVRQKAEEAKYPFEESNWEKTSRMLDAERQASRALKLKRFLLPGVLCLVIGSVGLLVYNYMNTPENQEQVLAQSSIQTTLDQPIDQNLPARSDEIRVASKQSNSNTGALETHHEKNLSGSSLPKPEKGSLPAEVNKTLAEKSGNEVYGKSSLPTNLSSEQKPKDEDRARDEEIVATRTDVSESGIKTTKTAPPLNADPVNSVMNENSSSSEKANVAGKSQVAGLEPGQNDPSATLNKEASQVADQLQVDRLKTLYLGLPVEMMDLELMPTPFTFLNRYDEDYYNNGKKSKTHFLNAELGGAYLLGWNASDGKDAKGINYFGGFNYGIYLSKKISIGIGVQAYNISNIQQPFYSTKRKEYDFGSTGIYTVVTSNDLYYASIPLKLNYAINAFNIIGLGLNAGYLFGSRNTVETFDDNTENPFVGAPVTTKGIYENTRTGNMMLSAHYKVQICQRVGVNAEFIYGMTDIFNNVGNVRTMEKPMGFRLSLQYTLFDK